MVRILVKKGDQPRFLLEEPCCTKVEDIIDKCCEFHNSILKINRIADNLTELADHGISMPPNMQGLTDEQICELKLIDEYVEKCTPSGGFVINKDEIGCRTGRAPKENMQNILNKTKEEAKQMVDKRVIDRGTIMTREIIKEALAVLSGAVTIVYPMGLPPYDPIQMEFNNEEELDGTHAIQEIVPVESGTLWFCGKEMLKGKLLSDFSGKNDKTKITIKLAKKGTGVPAREPVVSEAEQKEMMAYYYKKQEEWKKMDEKNDDDSYLNAPWADSQNLKRQFHGLNKIKW